VRGQTHYDITDKNDNDCSPVVWRQTHYDITDKKW
jgi:hypothetical protein